MPHTLPKLPYGYEALEPFVDKETMMIHHDKHHQAYIDKLNTVLEKYPDLQEKSASDLLLSLSSLNIDEKDKIVIRNHGGGHCNHSLFWEIMGPEKKVDNQLVTDIEKTYGSVEAFKAQFSDLAVTLFGSGWAWLAKDDTGKLHLHALPNQDSPYLHGHTPVFGLDVWEHAYYLKYQNRRAEYIKNWWSVLTLLP